MNVFFNMRSCIVACLIAANFAASPLSFAAAPLSQLAGKHLGQNRGLVSSVMQGRNYVIEVGKQGEIRQVLDAGANGSGKDAPHDVAGPAANGNRAVAEDNPAVELPTNYQGQAAVDFIGEDLPKIAEIHNLTPDKLKELLLTDSTIHIDESKHIFYVDDTAEEGVSAVESAETDAVAEVVTANNSGLPIDAKPAAADAFKLHSKPGASKTIFLDFDGHIASNTAWSATTIQAPAFDLDGNPAVFSDTEMNNIISVWSRVAEDYIPFDVDVTTEQPTDDALIRSSSADTVYGTRVVVTKKGTISCSCGGVAYVGVVAAVNAAKYQPAWVFHDSLANSEKYIAEAASHEAGHTLGLFHDGQKTTTTTMSYYAGHGTGATGWAPIMGVGYYKSVTQWSKGEYPNANNLQDDFAVMASNGFAQRADDVGNTLAAATPLNSAVHKAGVIESLSDVDMYRVDTSGGTLNAAVKPATLGANLDTALTLYDANGTVIAASAPETDLSASINTTLAAGTYYLGVKGSAHAAAGSDYGYTATGSLGQYLLAASYQHAGTTTAAASASSPTAALGAPSAAKVFVSSLKIKAVKGYGSVTARVAVRVVDDKNRPMANAVVRGAWSGSFLGKAHGKTAANGAAIQMAAAKAKKKGGSLTFTLAGIEAPGYVYSPNQNAKATVTVAW